MPLQICPLEPIEFMTTANLHQAFPYYVFSAPGPFFHFIVTLGVDATLGPVWKGGKEVYESVINGISISKKVFFLICFSIWTFHLLPQTLPCFECSSSSFFKHANTLRNKGWKHDELTRACWITPKSVWWEEEKGRSEKCGQRQSSEGHAK